MAVSLTALWLPILLSTLAVWVASFILWALLPWHRSDYGGLPDEEGVRAALSGAAPGAYHLPHAPSREAMQDPEHLKKLEQGPVGFVILSPPGVPKMGTTLVQWLVFNLVVSFVVAYVAGLGLEPGADSMRVFRLVASATWLAYGFGTVTESIWFARPWSVSVKNLVDGLIYGLLTAGFFGWLWPAAG